jgi:hypothetical protein
MKELEESGEFLSTFPASAQKGLDLNTRLQSLVNKSHVMLFMKGKPNEPKCGFSAKICEILNKNNIAYSSFDILTDEEVRQGLKVCLSLPFSFIFYFFLLNSPFLRRFRTGQRTLNCMWMEN